VALLCLQGDEEIIERVGRQEGEEAEGRIRDIISKVSFCPTIPLAYQLMLSRSERARELVSITVQEQGQKKSSSIAQVIGSLCSHPLFGFPILLLVLYFGLYQFVGVFGAGTLVGWIEEDLFGGVINPAVIGFVERFAAAGSPVFELFVGEY